MVYFLIEYAKYDKEKSTCNYSFTIEVSPDIMEETLINLFPYDTEIVTLR